MDIESIPQDEAHAKYRTAMVHMKKALESGKSADEAHEVSPQNHEWRDQRSLPPQQIRLESKSIVGY